MNTLYIIHGWTYTTDYWNKTLSLLKDSGLEVKMLHVPGLTEPSSQVFTIADYVKWADSNIPDNAIALGHSNGGRILLNLLSKNDKKLRGLILLSSAGIYEPSLKKSLFRKLSKILSPLKKLPLLRKIIHKLLGASDYDHAPENMKRTLENMLKSDQNLHLENISTPVRILWGEKDTVTPTRQGNKLKSALQNSDIRFYKGWNHAPYIDHPEELAKAILVAYNSLKEGK